MKNTKLSNIGWAIVSILIAILTIYTVSHQIKEFSWDRMVELIIHGRKIYLVMAVVCMLLFIFAEGEALRLIIVRIQGSCQHRQGIVYSAADIYFSAITPSASGGQPASLFFMMKDGIPISICTISLVYNLLMYNASIVFIAIACMVLRLDIYLHYEIYSRILIVIGIIALTGLMIGFYLLLRRSEWLLQIGNGFFYLLKRLHILKHTDKWEKKLKQTVERYEKLSTYLFKDKVLAVKIFFMNLLQRSIQICIAVFIYLGIGGEWKNIFDVWFTQAYSTIGSNCIPVPGAMGVIDYLLYQGFQNIMTDDMAVHTEMLTRGISFYVCITISFLMLAGAYLRKKKD